MDRLATIGPGGGPQISPVVFELNLDFVAIEIGGWDMGSAQKFRNVNKSTGFDRHRRRCLFEPFIDRGIEVRGSRRRYVTVVRCASGPAPRSSASTPRLISWGFDPGLARRDSARRRSYPG